MITLNLLPSEQKNFVSKLLSLHQWRQGLLVLLLAILFSVGGLLLEQTLLQTRLTGLNERLTTMSGLSGGNETENITRTTTETNVLITALTQATPSPRTWSQDYNRVLGELPKNISLTTLTMNDAGQVTITGVAATRSAFLQLEEALKNSSVLEKVTTASTPSTRENVPFSYNATVKPTL